MGPAGVTKVSPEAIEPTGSCAVSTWQPHIPSHICGIWRDFGLVSAHNLVETCSLKGAHYAQYRKTATSPSLRHHGAGPHGGDRGRGIPGGHPGQRSEQRIGI